MKRGREDEKTMEPMFPRLHVSDRERGGPRAPPRNKMALYEQFSVPSQTQTVNQGVLPFNPQNTPTVVPPPSTSQVSSHENGMFSSPHQHRSTHPAEKSYAGYSNFNPPPRQLEQKKKLDEDDFTVPIFVEIEIGEDHSKKSNGVDREEPKRQVTAVSPNLRRDSGPQELGSPNNSTSDSGYQEDGTCGSLHVGNGDRGDDASETSMVDSISGFDISPDDVVGVIGQKHFWKARRAIVNQQRVFAVQVFELHRLIKVQRSIAGSPKLLHEDGAYLGKPIKVSAPKKLPLEHIGKPSPQIVKHKDDSNNPNNTIESSDENAVGKTNLSSLQNVSQPSKTSTPFVTDTNTSAWCFPQPPGHQWLIPVMSPSEGLIYKPYPGHGFVGPVCGGYGIPGPNPMMGSFVNPAYSVPHSHHHNQGIGVPLMPPPFGHGYFPPYGMPVVGSVNSGSTVEQANHFAGPDLHDRPIQLPGWGTNFDLEHQISCKVPMPKNGAISNVGTKESELRGSTGSSPGEGARGRNALSLFPTSPTVEVVEREIARPIDETDQPRKVIKVVPRNAISATESAARIFRSIQEERKQFDSV